MSHILLREKAIKLRLQGQTYSQIKKNLCIPKSTLSDWLRNLPLDIDQLKLLVLNRGKSRDLAVEKYRATRQRTKIERLKKVLVEQQKELFPLTNKELFLAGLFLYWGEGTKHHGHVSVSNSDPKVLKFVLYWMIDILKVPENKIKIGLHLYKDMNIVREIKYWSQILGIPESQFNKPYIKKTNREGLTYKGYGHGTCNLVYCKVDLSEKIAMSIKAISDRYGAKSDLFWYN